MLLSARLFSGRSVAALCLFVTTLAPALASAQNLYSQPEPPNFGLLGKNLTPDYRQWMVTNLENYHDCKGSYGCYKSDLERETAVATADLDKAVRQSPGKKLALVLDIDETSLSNYPEMKSASLGYVKSAWDQWAQQAAAPAIPTTLALYRHARKLGVTVFFITGRPDSLREATDKNLRAQGYTDFAGLTLRSPVETKTATVTYKSAARARIVAQGYTLVESVGDQFSDLEGEPAAQYSIKLSDPFYYIP